MAYDPWPKTHNPWLMAHGVQPMAHGLRPMAHGLRPMANGLGRQDTMRVLMFVGRSPAMGELVSIARWAKQCANAEISGELPPACPVLWRLLDINGVLHGAMKFGQGEFEASE